MGSRRQAPSARPVVHCSTGCTTRRTIDAAGVPDLDLADLVLADALTYGGEAFAALVRADATTAADAAVPWTAVVTNRAPGRSMTAAPAGDVALWLAAVRADPESYRLPAYGPWDQSGAHRAVLRRVGGSRGSWRRLTGIVPALRSTPAGPSGPARWAAPRSS